MGVCTQSAGVALFVQFQGDFEMEDAWEVQDACQSLGMFYGMCLITFVLCI